MPKEAVKPTTRTNSGNSEVHRPVQTFDRLKKKKPQQIVIPVCLDCELLTAKDDLNQRILEAQAGRRADDVTALSAELDRLEAQIVDETVDMRFKSPGRVKYEALLLAHPPTPEQNVESQATHGDDAPYNAETFAPALIALCCIDPVMTEEEVAILQNGEYDEETGEEITPPWNLSEILPLFTASMAVCNASRVGELGKGSGVTRGSTKS